MNQTNKTLTQQVQTKEKVDTMQKVVLGVGMLCAFFTLINFAMLMSAGINNLGEQLTAPQTNFNRVVLTKQTDEERENAVQLSLNRELNNYTSYYPGQQNVTLLAFNLTNYTTSTLLMTQLKILAFVNGAFASGTPTTSSYFSAGYSPLDGGVYSNNLVNSLKLYQYQNGQYTLLTTTTPPIGSDGYVTFNNLNLPLPYTTSTLPIITLVLEANVSSSTPYGLFPDGIAMDINNCRQDVYVYNNQGQRVQVGPNNVNGDNRPVVYHEINFLPEPPLAPSFFTATGATSSIYLTWADVSNETGYRIWRSDESQHYLIVYADLPANVTSWTDINVGPASHYYYRLAAYNQYGNSPYVYADAWTLGGY